MEIVRLLTENGAVEGETVVSGIVVNRDDSLYRDERVWDFSTARPAAVTSVCSAAVEILKLLLDNGAKLYQSDFTDSGSALHSACIDRNQEKARWLLDRGADVNAESDKYGTPLHAVMKFIPTTRRISKEEEDRLKKETVLIVQLLISKGACVNQVNQKGDHQDTPLQAACGNELIDVETVRLLLKHGADINAEGGKHGTALGAACATYRPNDVVQLVQLLIRHGANVNENHEKSAAPLTIACRGGDEKLIRLLIESGADVRHQNYAAWYAAVQGRSVGMLRLLLDQAVDINYVHEEYGTALNAAIEEWDTRYGRMQEWHDTLGFLLEHGADANIKSGKFGFALQTACAPEYRYSVHFPSDINIISERTKFLLEQCPGINVNAQGGMFGSALQAAAFSGQTESVQLLLGRGADVDARGGMYGSALNAAIIGGYWDIVEILLQAKATPDYCLQQQPDEEWLRHVGEKCPRRVGRRYENENEIKNENENEKKDGRAAVARYRKFWEVESGSTAESG
ncbi:putative ankyrin repeat protein L93 [Trichoderma asperellum]|uniref:Putative ankyrin repeat protein L93 n=1 Tax=Trichoderma asperellum TaxID=101201 RepID=A0A6V8QZB3_TRIAP|nr:putative ankyrin repeat protein L93 [Trichoderma asperellum]